MTERPDETVPKIDRRTRLAALARYARVFTAPGFEFATWPEFRSDGERCSPLDECLMGPEATAFIKDAYANGWVDLDFDWVGWGKTEEGTALRTNPSSIPQATEDQIRKLLTGLIRNDRFCDGALVGAFTDGYLAAIACRAENLLNGERKMRHILSSEFEDALRLEDGVLHPVLSLAHKDKDVILEIRCERVDLYCKGNVLFQVLRNGNDYQILQPDRAFTEKPNFLVGTGNDLKLYIASEIPFIKQRIACHKRRGSEIEFEQAIVRAANFESANPHYLIVDRQVATPGRTAQIDLLGILWKDHSRLEAFPALCEAKYLTRGGVGGIAEQIKGYYDFISLDFDSFKNDMQALLSQKARLGLFPGLETDAQENLKKVRIVGDISKLDIVAALVDYSPNAGQEFLEKLRALPFASQVTVQRLGFAMWKGMGRPVSD